MRGRFIVFEGIDGAGTTTQATRLAKHLDAQLEREPADPYLAGVIRASLGPNAPQRYTAVQLAVLFSADRVLHYEGDIRPALERGTHVVCDRYTLSTWAYQRPGFEAAETHLRFLLRVTPPPDLTIVLDLPPPAALARMEDRPYLDSFELDRPLQEKVRELYLAEARTNPAVVVIDASRPPDIVFGQVLAAIGELDLA